MAGHVFISYSHSRDRSYVDRLAARLTLEGIAVWYDKELIHGDRWARVIREQVDTCAAFVVVMSPEAEQSEWVANEIDQARLMNRPILPLLLDGQRFFALASTQYEDVTGDRMPGPAFVARLAALVGRPSLAPPVDEEPVAAPVAQQPPDPQYDPYADEFVVIDLHPHASVMILPTLWLIPMALSVAAIVWFDLPEWAEAGLGAISAVALTMFLWRLAVWRSTRYVFTNVGILLSQGLFARHQRSIPLNRVNDIASQRSLLQRLVGSGTLVIESAGERGQSHLTNVPRVRRVHRLLQDLVEQDQKRNQLS